MLTKVRWNESLVCIDGFANSFTWESKQRYVVGCLELVLRIGDGIFACVSASKGNILRHSLTKVFRNLLFVHSQNNNLV